MLAEPAYFISDAHLGQGDARAEATKLERLEEFLAGVRSRPGPLYINGDLFDFWFEYRHSIPRRHLRALSALEQTRGAGIAITYVGGNHDFWLGDFLTREMGLEVSQEPLELTLQGRRIFLAHGDGLIRGDTGYRILKAILRFPPNIWLYRWLHPDLGIPLAEACSRLSYRQQHQHRPPPTSRIQREIADPRLAAGFDAVVLGHFHVPYHRRAAGRDTLVLGDWTRHFTWATLEEGVFRLWRYTEGGAEELPAVQGDK